MMFHNVLLCFTMFRESRNDQHRRIATTRAANRLRGRNNAAGIGDNSAEIGDNSAEIGNDAAGIVILLQK